MPDRKNRREAEEIYYVNDNRGRLTINDISINDGLLSGISLKTTRFLWEKDLNKMREELDWWRRTVGLAT